MPTATLRPRQLEVAQLVAAGHSDETIAGVLVIPVVAVEAHVAVLKTKLRVRRRTEIRWALEKANGATVDGRSGS